MDKSSTRYPVYLETDEQGRCMAHVLDLPGCFVRAASRDAALARLPDAIRDHCAWLRRHGVSAPPEGEPAAFEVVCEALGTGPFDPGCTAALFPPEQEPVTLEEMEDHFRLMAHARDDLLALVRDLPDETLDWQAGPASLSVRRLLRHVGDAEEWYVSRLVDAETLPPEWERDEELPVLEFLEMERRTALERLRQLSDEERAGVFTPTAWTGPPEEPWTARKVLRRFLEHEREHTAQAREILASQRDHLLARLAAERAELLWQLMALDEETLAGVVAFDGWTVKDVLAHVAFWDRWEGRTMRCMLAGEERDLSAVLSLDATNAAVVAEWRDRSLDEVVVELQAARAGWLAWLRTVSEAAFFRQRFVEGVENEDWSFPGCLKVQWEHDAGHAAQIRAWREGAPLQRDTGPKEILLAALDAAREELLAVAALVPPDERASRLVCGEWTLKDVLAHVTDWEWVGVQGLRHMAAGQPPDVEHIADIDAWNRVHYDLRRDQPWEEVWAELHAAREALVGSLERMRRTALARSFVFPWGQEGTAYQWVGVYVAHDREHAHGLREKGPPVVSIVRWV